MSLTTCSVVTNRVATLDDLPNDVGGLSAAQLKAVFDQYGTEFVAWFNATHIVEVNAIGTAVTTNTGNIATNTTDINKYKYRMYMEV